MCNQFTPLVYWAQNKSSISLKIELGSAKDIDVFLTDQKLKFLAYGKGARGFNNYSFSLHCYSNIDYQSSSYEILENQINFLLKKKSIKWWPRLISEPQKPHWLKIDFDKWKSDFLEYQMESNRSICEDYPDVYDQLHKEEFGYKKEECKKVYLVFYNLFQCIGYMYIFIVMTVKYWRNGEDYFENTYETVGQPFKILQIIQFLEVMHPLFKYTDGVTEIVFIQVISRAFILFCMIDAEPRMQEKPVVFYVFTIWAIAEIIRYPYYLSRLMKTRISFLTWLRYTIWIPLYPFGFILEGIIVIRNIPYFEETKKFTVSLPNEWNFALHFPSLMKLYLLMLCIPGMVIIISHLSNIRKKKFTKCQSKSNMH